MMRSDLIELSAIFVHETDKAVLWNFGGKNPIWLPKSQHEFVQDVGARTCTVTMKEDFAMEKGLV